MTSMLVSLKAAFDMPVVAPQRGVLSQQFEPLMQAVNVFFGGFQAEILD